MLGNTVNELMIEWGTVCILQQCYDGNKRRGWQLLIYVDCNDILRYPVIFWIPLLIPLVDFIGFFCVKSNFK